MVQVRAISLGGVQEARRLRGPVLDGDRVGRGRGGWFILVIGVIVGVVVLLLVLLLWLVMVVVVGHSHLLALFEC